ncbi:unnamed protein product [Rotaria sp. Silwood2]|nr:unnamed protein product [Rotaria sp. Silwood2]CAF2662830.1 unnamed protein product [Rotaria sp. Silwood2]CAF2893212.1 unnamed protein product [Rotaria sp. Silwood2]CAF3073660.1 unnamed protein product [Rotaria sp. Silwood2]CAF4035412.1 unnamed protein product [Rotaria sp. Silwood2]
MGCKQTTTKSPPVVIATSPTTSTYVKSALKKSNVKGGEKTEKLSFLKQKVSTLNKSVNFNEKVQVKLRTPTPREKRYEKTLSAKIVKRQIHNDTTDDDDDDDDEVTSISSQEDNIINEQNKKSKSLSSQSLQRSQSNAFWQKNNSIGVISRTNNIKEKTQPPPTAIQQPPVTMITDSTENSNIPIGNRFRVRRKVQYPVLPQASSPVVSTQSPTASSSSPIVRTSSPLIQRPLPSTNAILIEHHTSFSNGGSAPKAANYAINRHPIDKPNST